jgi:hypothetical protein
MTSTRTRAQPTRARTRPTSRRTVSGWRRRGCADRPSGASPLTRPGPNAGAPRAGPPPPPARPRGCRGPAPSRPPRGARRVRARGPGRPGAVEDGVDDGDDDEGEQGRADEPADHGDRHRRAQLAALPQAERHRQRPSTVVEVVIRIGTQAHAARPTQGLALGLPATAQLVRVVDEDDALLTTMPASRMTPISTTTLMGSERADEGHTPRRSRAERHGEQDDEGVQQRLELRGHHQVDHEDGEQHGEAHASERGLHLLALAAEAPVEAGRQVRPASRARGCRRHPRGRVPRGWR